MQKYVVFFIKIVWYFVKISKKKFYNLTISI